MVGDLLLDRNVEVNTGGAWPYPFTIQNLMWIMFFFGLGEIYIRLTEGKAEADQCNKGFLPEDEETMLQSKDLGAIYARIRGAATNQTHYLQRMMARSIMQFQASGSVDQANSLHNSSVDMFHHEIDLKYNMLRYLVWLIPTLGFIGTVVGIALALGVAGDVPDIATQPEAVRPWVQSLTASLGVAFYTTLLALIQSAILVFLLHIAQGREELALNRAAQYCLDNLINRLYENRRA